MTLALLGFFDLIEYDLGFGNSSVVLGHVSYVCCFFSTRSGKIS